MLYMCIHGGTLTRSATGSGCWRCGAAPRTRPDNYDDDDDDNNSNTGMVITLVMITIAISC